MTRKGASRKSSLPNGSADSDPLATVKSNCPELLDVLSEYLSELNNLKETAPFTNSSWLKHLELSFVLRAHRVEVFRALRRALASGAPGADEGGTPAARKADLEAVDGLLKAVDKCAQDRLAAAPAGALPLVLRLAHRYNLTGPETDMFQLLFVRGCTTSEAFRAVLGPRHEDRDFDAALCGMSSLDIDDFLDDKRTHIVEGVVVEQVDDYEGKCIRMAADAVSVLLLRPLKTEQRLKLSKTEVLGVLEETPLDKKRKELEEDEPISNKIPKNKRQKSTKKSPEKAGNKVEKAEDDIDEVNEEMEINIGDNNKNLEDVLAKALEGAPIGGQKTAEAGALVEEALGVSEEKEGGLFGEQELKPYKSSLEYLDDSFQVLAVMLRESKARHKQDLKAASSEEKPWYDQYRNSKTPSLRELRAKLKFAQNRLQERLALTEAHVKAEVKIPESIQEVTDMEILKSEANREKKVEKGKEKAGDELGKSEEKSEQEKEKIGPSVKAESVEKVQENAEIGENNDKKDEGAAELPRLESLARKLGLDVFEKFVVVMLTGLAISPVVKSIFEVDNGDGGYRRNSDTVQVKDILTVYYDTFKDQVLARTYFYKSSKLVARGVIKMRAAPYTRGGGDLMEQQVELDRRMLDWIVGLDTEMNELVEGSHLYKPKVAMPQVVLPNEQKEMLLRTVDNFAKFKAYRHKAGLEDVVSYGAGLVLLLCGASGTGKTMTVNALAHHLGKRVLLVDFHSLTTAVSSSGGRGDDASADLRGLFRDAEMNDAIIFFDECEAIFAQRSTGGDRVLNSLLTEMERHEGIIMLATNRPLDLDEAMHRRITAVSEFRPPDHTQRKRIWELQSQKLPLQGNIDWERIALRYELTGGYIKNALMSALLIALSRDGDKPTVTEQDVTEGCQLQMRGSLQMKSFSHRVVPKSGLDDLVLPNGMRSQLQLLTSFEKARGIMVGQWGFAQERVGTAALFWGAHGTGKSAAAEAIGFELGRPLKVVNCAQLLSQESSTKTGNNITVAFKDARLMDAIMVLEDFQIFRSEEEGGSVGSVSAWSPLAMGLLLYELERFPGVCILIANNITGSIVHRLEPELLRRLRFLIEFKTPDATVRARMWRKMLPEKVPLAEDVNFEDLGKRFDFTSGAINGATVRAAAKVALRAVEQRKVFQKDLLEAAEDEKNSRRDELDEIALRAFI